MTYIRDHIQNVELSTIYIPQNDNTFYYIVYYLSPPQAKNFLEML